MKNKKIIFALFAVTLIICGYMAFVSYFSLGDLKYDEQTIDMKTEEYQISVRYPKITSGIPLLAKNRVNRQMEEWAQNFAQKAKDNFTQQIESDTYKLIEKEQGDVSLSFVSDTTFDVRSDFSKLSIFSVYFETYTYTGGAHGGISMKIFNFDAKRGDDMTPGLIFRENYLDALSKTTFNILNQEDESHEIYAFLEEGTLPKRENFEIYIITPDGIEVIFNQYQVGPYVIGRPSVLVPYDDIHNVLTPRFLALIKK